MDKLEHLWSIAVIEGKRRELQFPTVFDPIGLILIKPIAQEQYKSTPLNSMAFATTGGDGVHFSLIEINGEISDHSPIVMTVPMNFGNENLIVGSNFNDFLCLGCEVSFFFLELLTYRDTKSETLYWLSHPEEWVKSLKSDLNNIEGSDITINLLKLLRSELDLHPWDNIEEKLQSLDDKYFSLLELKSD